MPRPIPGPRADNAARACRGLSGIAPRRPLRRRGATHRHQELQRAHIVALGLLELAEHAHAQPELFLQVLGALVAHGGRRARGGCRAACCPGPARPRRKVAASAESEHGLATLHTGERLGRGQGRGRARGPRRGRRGALQGELPGDGAPARDLRARPRCSGLTRPGLEGRRRRRPQR